LSRDLREPLPEHDVVPLSAVLPFATFIFIPFIGSEREFRHRRTAGRVFYFRIFAEIPQQNHFVNALSCHKCSFRHTPAENRFNRSFQGWMAKYTRNAVEGCDG